MNNLYNQPGFWDNIKVSYGRPPVPRKLTLDEWLKKNPNHKIKDLNVTGKELFVPEDHQDNIEELSQLKDYNLICKTYLYFYLEPIQITN